MRWQLGLMVYVCGVSMSLAQQVQFMDEAIAWTRRMAASIG
jgi:hypothetical protein